MLGVVKVGIDVGYRQVIDKTFGFTVALTENILGSYLDGLGFAKRTSIVYLSGMLAGGSIVVCTFQAVVVVQNTIYFGIIAASVGRIIKLVRNGKQFILQGGRVLEVEVYFVSTIGVPCIAVTGKLIYRILD